MYAQVRVREGVGMGACWRRSRTGPSKPGGPEAGAGQLQLQQPGMEASSPARPLAGQHPKTTLQRGALANDEARAGRRQQQNKQLEPGWPLQLPTVAPARDPILGPAGHELGELGLPNMPKLAPAPPPASILSRPSCSSPAQRARPGQGTTLLELLAVIPSYTSLSPRPKLARHGKCNFCQDISHRNLGTFRKVEHSSIPSLSMTADVMLCHPVVVHNNTR